MTVLLIAAGIVFVFFAGAAAGVILCAAVIGDGLNDHNP